MFTIKETLINSLCGKIKKEMQGLPFGRHAHGAQEPRHISKYVEVTSQDIQLNILTDTARHLAMAIRPHSELISVS